MKEKLLQFLQDEEIHGTFEGQLSREDSPYDLTGLDIDFPIDYSMTIYKVGRDLELESTVEYVVNTNCSRCLAPVAEEVEDSSEIYVTKNPVEEEGDEREILVVEDFKELPVEKILFSQVISSIPQKPLCKEDCEGICPHCGKDLNEGPCDCEDTVEEIDNPFAELKDLFIEEEV